MSGPLRQAVERRTLGKRSRSGYCRLQMPLAGAVGDKGESGWVPTEALKPPPPPCPDPNLCVEKRQPSGTLRRVAVQMLRVPEALASAVPQTRL